MKPLPPKPSDSEMYERAFEHASAFTKLEIDAVRANYTRFFGMVALAIGALAWLGYKDRQEMREQLRRQMQAEVSDQIAEAVPKEIAAQLSTPQVHAVVQKAFEDYSQSDIDKRLSTRVDALVATAVAAQRSEIDRHANALLKQLTPTVLKTNPASTPQVQGAPQVQSTSPAGLKTTSATAKHLTGQQMAVAVSQLRSAPPGEILIWSHGDDYSQSYASDLLQVFREGNWKVTLKVQPGWTITNSTWIALLYAEPHAKDPTIAAALAALNAAHIGYETRGGQTMVMTFPNGRPAQDGQRIAMEIGAP